MHTILLADDAKLTLAIEKAYLETRNLKVFVTTAAEEVLFLARRLSPDLIVMDFEMPEMNGDEVCRRLKENPDTASIPVLILSAHDDPETRRRTEEAGAVGFVRKAEGREKLLDRVVETLGVARRRHVRVSCHVAVGILEGGHTYEATFHNISVGGVYLTIQRQFQTGAPLRLQFTLPGEETDITVLGEVVRCETLSPVLYGYGVQFLEADEACIEALERFVARSL